MLVREDLRKVKAISKIKIVGAGISFLAMSFAGTSIAKEKDDIYYLNGSYNEGAYYHPDEDKYDMPKLEVKKKSQNETSTSRTSVFSSRVTSGNYDDQLYPEVNPVEAPEQTQYVLPYCSDEIITDCIPRDDQYIEKDASIWYGNNPVYGENGSYCLGTQEACMRNDANWQKMIEELQGNIQANS